MSRIRNGALMLLALFSGITVFVIMVGIIRATNIENIFLIATLVPLSVLVLVVSVVVAISIAEADEEGRM